jgi:hypothetical protein
MYVPVCERLGQPKAKRPPDIIRIILIDPTGIFKNYDKLRAEFTSALERKFNRSSTVSVGNRGILGVK